MATLTVTLKEELELNGRDRGSEMVKDITGITETFHRILDVGTASDQTLTSSAQLSANRCRRCRWDPV